MKFHIVSRHTGLSEAGKIQQHMLFRALEAGGAEVECSTSEEFNPQRNDVLGLTADTIVIVMGGDGTMLNIAKRVAPTPVLGINLGRLGFITDIPGDFDPLLLAKLLIAGSYTTESRVLLGVHAGRHGLRCSSDVSFALNDLAIKATGGKLIDVSLFVNDEHAYTMRSDGVIVSTPTGSTAYNLSAGGPIMHSSMQAVCVTPLHPQTLSHRPIILPFQLGGESLKIELVVKGEAQLLNDGAAVWAYPTNATTERKYVVTPSHVSATFLHVRSDAFPHAFPGAYFEGLRTKLNWFLPPC